MSTVYHGLTADELADELHVESTIDNLEAYREENAQLSAASRARFPNARLDVAYGGEADQKLDIFAPDGADGNPVLMYIHGGGWRGGSKNLASLCADAVIFKGVLWVPIDYGLAPSYDIVRIVDHVRSAIAWVHSEIAGHGGDPGQIYLSGNSAGGHLTGTALMAGWQDAYGVPGDVIKGACAMSGVFDLDALLLASWGYNDELKLTAESARKYSPHYHLPAESGPLIAAVGKPEPAEFRRQTAAFSAAWMGAGLEGRHMEVPGANHFAMSRELGNADGDLFAATMKMIGV